MTTINMVGKPCPIPVIEAKKAIKAAVPGESVSILVDNDISRQNLEKMATGLGHAFEYKKTEDNNILATITLEAECRIISDDETGLVVVIGRDEMGGGSQELGKTLMKSFIFSLTELDYPPEHLLFFNGGVHLTTEGSNALDDLAALAEKGTLISSCGACLNYYGLTEKLKIGNVTNMYAIAGTMAQAKKLINM
ncbi:sulfurtransferase-like selenium metabolism protein YedF [Deltaproteobacteria bacterium Smac51]|nr:sulfurtransferase-like selenium metabolism protein YedF [Deltaproteobacteria bacterium Smac51]